MDHQSILALYRTVAEITSQMLSAAREEDWESLTALEARCESYVEKIKACEPTEPLSSEQRDSKVAIIQRILADDREIRMLVEPWMARLSALLSSNGAERKLAKAYGGSMFN